MVDVKNGVMLNMLNNSQKGFNLVELMIVVLILAIVASIAIPSFKNFIANTQIRNTTESIRNGLQIARAEAVKRNAIVNFKLNADKSWVIGCPTITTNCPATIQAKPSKEGAAATTNLTLIGADNVSFTNLGTVTPAVGQLSQVNIDSSAIPAANTTDLQVTIGIGGNVRVCDPNVSATTDPRHC